jgi:hypothetical protein
MSMAGIAPEDDDGNAAAKAAPKGEDRKPAGPPQEALDAAKDSLAGADSLDQLKAIWSDLPKPVQTVPAIIQAKDARKAELDQPARPDNSDLADEIPY